MKWLSYLLAGLIGFCLGIIFTYWIQGQIIYENIQSFVITGATTGVVLSVAYKGLDMVTSWRNGQKKERKEATINLIKHTEALLPELKKIADNPSTSSTEYLFSLAQQHVNSNEQLNNILNGENGLKNTESSYTTLLKKINTHIEEAINTQFPRIDSATSNLLLEDLKEFHEKMRSKGKSYAFVAVPDASNTNATLQSIRNDDKVMHTYLEGKKDEMLTFAEKMNNLLKDTSLKEMFNTREKLIQQLYQFQTTFAQKSCEIIDKINCSVLDEGKILRWYCDECEAVKKKWKIP